MKGKELTQETEDSTLKSLVPELGKIRSGFWEEKKPKHTNNQKP